ncbi:MAG: response regulator [Micavibrio sp.]|nr:response regulator [Micavibrio sp.]
MIETLCEACGNALATKSLEPDKTVPQGAAAGSYVLLVDDDRELAALLSARLESRGIHVMRAADGGEAMRQIETRIPDLVILDVMLPGLSGHAVLQKLKFDPALSLIPVVMLSANAAEGEAESAKRLGAIDYILKPVEAEALIAHLEKILDAARYHVVLMDNDDTLLDLLGEKFRQRGFRVSTRNDGKEAWDYILKSLPDLVILDRMMPGMDGIAVLKNIRAEHATKNIPVIVLSARKEERDVKIGLQFGAQEYVTKPCDPEDLLNRSLALLQAGGSEKIRQAN